MSISIHHKHVSISPVAVDTGLWRIRYYCMTHYGADQSDIDIAPLAWYIYTSRATGNFLRAVLSAKPFMIGRILHKGGSYDEAIANVKAYLTKVDPSWDD